MRAGVPTESRLSSARGCVPRCSRPGELRQLSFQVTGIPERDLVEKFSPDRPDESLDERMPVTVPACTPTPTIRRVN